MKNQNKNYKKFNFELILSDFYQLRLDIIKTQAESMQRYAIIRTVTIIEQFFRAIVVLKLSDVGETGEIEEIIIQENIILLKTLIVSALEQQDEAESSEEICKCVEQFIKTSLKDHTGCNITNDTVTIPIMQLKELIEACSEHPVYILRYVLIATSFSFQNTNLINYNMKKLKIFTKTDVFFGEKKRKFDNLFDARHVLIHSIGKTNLDIQPYFELIETLFQDVLEEIRPGVSYFDFVKGSVLCTIGLHNEAIRCLTNAVEHPQHEPRASILLGKALFDLKEKEEACNRLWHALDEAKKLGQIILKSKANGENHESTENMIHDTALHCIQIGEIAHSFGEIDLAWEAWMTAAGYNPGLSKLYRWIGRNFEAIKEYEMAIICYQNLIEKCPNDAENHQLLGDVLLMAGKYEEAVEKFKKAEHLRQSK